jgi:Kef-type K+ transport system membrane component KefB
MVKKLHNRNELLTISIGTIFVCTGISNIFHLSLILSNMVMGVTVSNISLLSARRTFDAVQGITSPIYIAFFVLAGAHLQIGLLPKIGLLGIVYVLLRSFSKIGGNFLGAYVSRADINIRKYLGIAMLTQAGVAIGLAMIVQREFGVYENITTMVINTIMAATIIFDIIGPIGVKYAVEKTGESGRLK